MGDHSISTSQCFGLFIYFLLCSHLDEKLNIFFLKSSILNILSPFIYVFTLEVFLLHYLFLLQEIKTILLGKNSGKWDFLKTSLKAILL